MTLSHSQHSHLVCTAVPPPGRYRRWSSKPGPSSADFVNKGENSFDATYRSAVSYNNTFINDNALALQVSPHSLKHRIVSMALRLSPARRGHPLRPFSVLKSSRPSLVALVLPSSSVPHTNDSQTVK